MDDIEYQFVESLARNMSELNGKMTDGKSSKYTGFGGQRNEQLARKLVREGKGRGDVAGSTSPIYQPNNMDTNLKPIEITPDMIKEIQELEGNIILPEYANRKNIIGNPSQVHTISNSNKQNQLPPNVASDPNQLELNFDKISVDNVYEQYGEVLKQINFLKKELKVIKGLVETLVNEK